MDFEFDPKKSAINAEKHGIDFANAQLLWVDPNRVEFIARFEVRRSGSYRCGGREHMKKNSTMTAEQFDERFDRGEDISAFVDTSTISRPGLEVRRVNVDFPEWVIQSLDNESRLIGVSRQSLIKLWISERLQEERRARA